MKIRNILIGVAFLASGTANATTVFAPTDGDVNFILGLFNPSDTILAMFDDSDQSFMGSQLVIDIPEEIAIAVSGGGNFKATGNLGMLTLTGSDHFILAVSTDGGANWSGNTGIVDVGANSYNVVFSNGTVVEVDVQVIPVPAAVWLFGSGLLGLVGIARRKKAA